MKEKKEGNDKSTKRVHLFGVQLSKVKHFC